MCRSHDNLVLKLNGLSSALISASLLFLAKYLVPRVPLHDVHAVHHTRNLVSRITIHRDFGRRNLLAVSVI
jgi:hypothetical protein